MASFPRLIRRADHGFRIQDVLIALFFGEIFVAAILMGGKSPDKVGPVVEWSGQGLAELVFSRPVWIEPRTGIIFVWVGGGCFVMGCVSPNMQCGQDEFPVHRVCLDGFWMGRYPVTQAQWRVIFDNDPSDFAGSPDRPVESVSWHDVQEFLSRINKTQADAKFRLPTEAEWEYACRSGGGPETYAGSMDPGDVAWHRGNSGGTPHPVGRRMPNGLELFDMSGNVSEWVQDVYDNNAYERHGPHNPLIGTGLGPLYDQYLEIIEGYIGDAAKRVLRGGSWRHPPKDARCSNRSYSTASSRENYMGFRLVLDFSRPPRTAFNEKGSELLCGRRLEKCEENGCKSKVSEPD